MQNTLVPMNDWLDKGGDVTAMTQTTLTTTSDLGFNSTSGGLLSNCTHYINYWPYYGYVYTTPRPIKLTLSEIERLRKAAKADSKLKAILAKFTDQIEITVDFE